MSPFSLRQVGRRKCKTALLGYDHNLGGQTCGGRYSHWLAGRVAGWADEALGLGKGAGHGSVTVG